MIYLPTPADYLKAKKHKLKERGITYPVRTVWAARQASVRLAIACALQEQETGDGSNIYGHDAVNNPIKSPTRGLLKVTKQNYATYKNYRKRGYGMQGVGPVQLTWFETQDHADALGGCWKPEINIYVGLQTLKQNIANKGSLWAGCKAYNGTGPAAITYANLLTDRIDKWHRRFKGDK